MLNNIQATDIQLIQAIQKGNEKAFDIFFKKHYIALCTYGKQFVSLEDAEEVAQEVMIWLWENRGTLLLDASPIGYLYKAVKNRCLSMLSRQELKQSIFDTLRHTLQEAYEPSDAIDFEALSATFSRELDKLPPTYKQAFVLNRFQHRTYKEIAMQLGVSSKTVDYRIQQALKALRIQLKDYLLLLAFLAMTQ